MPSLLMCRPVHYTIAYEINPWMHVRRQVARRRAAAQWRRLHAVLTKELKLPVRLVRPVPGLPDLVFTANAGLVAGRTFIRSNFRHPERQGEEAVFEAYFAARGFRVVTLPRAFNFEGEGDALWLGRTLVLGFRFRSEAPSHDTLSRLVRAEVLPVELIDRRFYHLDTCFCPLDAKTVLWYPKAFDRYARRVIERLAAETIAVSEADAKRFVCNAVVVGRSIVLQAGASSRVTRALARRGFRLHPVDLSEFLKAGGSAKCLVLRFTSHRP